MSSAPWGTPRDCTRSAHGCTSAMGTDTRAETLWLAIAPVGFLMLGLLMLGIAAVAIRLTDYLVGMSWPGVVAALISGVAFVQTAWFSSFLSYGNVMNMVVGICLISLLLLGLRPGIFGSTTGSIACGSVLAVTSNSWQLLIPVAGLASLPWIVEFLRQGARRAKDWACWALFGAVALNGVLALGGGRGGAISEVVAVTVSNLFRPDWWWYAAIAISFVATFGAMRRGLTAWALMAQTMLVGGALVVLLLVRMTGSSWDLMLYYPVKALWTTMVIVIPMASAGVVGLVATSWRHAGKGSVVFGPLLRGGVALAAGVVIVAVLGRGAAFPPHVAQIAEGRAGLPTWSLALVDLYGRSAGARRCQGGSRRLRPSSFGKRSRCSWGLRWNGRLHGDGGSASHRHG